MHLSTEESGFLRDLVHRESAIVLESGKEYLLATRLVSVMRSREITSFGQLVTEIRRTPHGPLVTAVVEAMTTNETSFFRDLHPWTTLRTDLLPTLVERRASSRSLTFLCAACSSGQEPYSLAMTIREYFPLVAANWRVRILANDLSTEMVDRTKAGRFSQIEIGRGLPAPLMAEYFTRETKTSILRDAGSRLRPDGFLMLGSSETTLGIDHTFDREQLDKTVFYRPAGAPTSVAGRPGSPNRTAADLPAGHGASGRSPQAEVAPLATPAGLRSFSPTTASTTPVNTTATPERQRSRLSGARS